MYAWNENVIHRFPTHVSILEVPLALPLLLLNRLLCPRLLRRPRWPLPPPPAAQPHPGAMAAAAARLRELIRVTLTWCWQGVGGGDVRLP